MNKIFFFIILSNFLIFSQGFSQPPWTYNDYNYIGESTDDKISDIKFVDANTGFAAVVNNVNSPFYAKVYKTTDRGLNWTMKLNLEGSHRISLDFADADFGVVAFGRYLFRTLNGGDNFSQITIPTFWDNRTFTKVKMKDENTAYIASYGDYIESIVGNRFAFANVGRVDRFSGFDVNVLNFETYTQNHNDYWYYISDMDIDDINGQVALVGYYGSTSNYESFASFGNTVLKSRNGKKFDYVSFFPNSSNFRIFGSEGVLYYPSINTTTPAQILNPLVADASKPQMGFGFLRSTNQTMVFTDPETAPGYAATNDGKIYRTINGGINWTLELQDIPSLTVSHLRYKISNFKNIVYYGGAGNKLYTRKLTEDIAVYYDNIRGSGTFVIDGVNCAGISLLRGGTMNMVTAQNVFQSELNTGAVFYKWYDDSFAQDNFFFYKNGYFDTENNVISCYYKTNQYSTIPGAISNPNSTKTIKDKVINGVNKIHQIHESLGSIFYAKSSDNGATFQDDEIISRNYENPHLTSNKNASIDIIKDFATTNPVSIYDAEKNVIASWEYQNYINNQTITEIKVANRVRNLQDNAYIWKNYGENSSNYVFTSFNSSPNYNSKPKIFAAANSYNTLDDSRTFYIAVPHLEPSTNGGNKIVVTSRYTANNVLNSVIDDGNISDFSVAAQYNGYLGYVLHFAYNKGGKIYYKKASFGYDFTNHLYYLNPTVPLEVSYNTPHNPVISSVDISITGPNNYPVIAYKGTYPATRVVNFEENNPENPFMISLNYQSIFTVCKTDVASWSNILEYKSDGIVSQSDPNIEGCKADAAYILNFNRNSNQNLQFVKFTDGTPQNNYHCSPAVFNGTDAKIVRNSYLNRYASGSAPQLLTLKPQSSRYRIGKQDFTITNTVQPISDIDAFSNLKGVIRQNNISYIFQMGPILVKNTPVPLGDINSIEDLNGSAISITNAQEFNEYLTCSPFTLNNGDTIILGTNGCFSQESVGGDFYNLAYNVDLMRLSDGSIERTLFSDVITKDNDYLLEFYRGFVINDLGSANENYYIQIHVAEFDGMEPKFSLEGVFEGYVNEIGDNSVANNTAVLFKNTPPRNLSSVKPSTYSLAQNYPNPFNPTTTIKFSIPKDGLVKIRVYDISGREVANLINEVKVAGNYEIKFNGANLSSGMYFYRIESGDYIETKKMILIK